MLLEGRHDGLIDSLSRKQQELNQRYDKGSLSFVEKVDKEREGRQII